MRPTDCTPEVTALVCKALETGCYKASAAAAAGISPASMRDWCRKGRAGQEPYATFLAAVKTAEEVSQVTLCALILSSAHSKPEAWTAAAWLLERRSPQRWARVERKDPVATTLPQFKSATEALAYWEKVKPHLEQQAALEKVKEPQVAA